MIDEKEEKSKSFFTPLITISIIFLFIVVVSNFYFFYFKKDFPFLVEVSCNPTMETCFERDCSNPDDCPPNGLSVFKRYSLNANDFKYCENEDCTLACQNNQIKCTPVVCEENLNMGETCTVISSEINNLN